MGRFLSGTGGSSAAGSGIFKLKAGVAIAPDDLVQLGPNGKAYPVKCTDYAAVANCNYGTAQTSAATGQIVAQTQVVAALTTANSRQAVVQGDDGSIFALTTASASGGLMLSKYAASGSLSAQAVIDSSSNTFTNNHLYVLSNGNIAALATNSGGLYVSFAIYDQNLVVIKSLTNSEMIATALFSACALSGGGFAIVYQQNANPLLSRLATFDNTGTAVLAPTTIWTRTGTSGTQYHRIAQLSSNNLVIAVSSANTVSSIGLYHGIVTTAGAAVRAFENIDTNTGSVIPDLSVMTSYYAIARPNSSFTLGFVFNNTGTLQGANFSGANSGTVSSTLQKIVNDGTAFYLIWPRGTDNKEVLTKLPVTGTGYVTSIITTTVVQNSNHYIDAFCENGLIVGVSMSGSNPTAPVLWVINAQTMTLLASAATSFGVAPQTGNGQYLRVIPGGDFSFICLYDYANLGSTNLCVGKYANTAVMGVAQTAAAADGLFEVAGLANGYAANYIKGSPSKAFDHSATNIIGNKGVVLNNGAVLKGL